MNEFGTIILTLVLLLMSIILHELAHGMVAFWLGDRTAKANGRLTLNPFSHLEDPIMSFLMPLTLLLMRMPVMGGAKPVPVDTRNLKWREWGMALVALAGPLTNFILAFILFLIYAGTGSQVIFSAMTVNLSLMIFNLLPIPPLDGSRIIYAIAPDKVREWIVGLENYGVFIIYGLILLFGNGFASLMTSGMNAVYQFFRFIIGA